MHTSRRLPYAAVAAACALLAGAAWSQPARSSPCGDAVAVVRGDTLSRIAQRCDVGEGALLAANPRVRDSGDLEVGTRLSLRRAASDDRSRPDDAAARLGALASRTGEALGGIAGEVGSSVEDLLGQTPALREQLRRLGLPGVDARAKPPAIAIFPRQGPVGTSVTLSAVGLPPNATVAVGGGPRRAAYEVLDQVRTTGDGTLDATVQVPGWATDAGSFVFVVADAKRDLRVRSDAFTVTAGLAPTLDRP